MPAEGGGSGEGGDEVERLFFNSCDDYLKESHPGEELLSD